MTPLTTNDKVVCPHQGQVVLQSNKGKNLELNNKSQAITKNDLLNADIIGCTRTVAGVSVPCTKVTSVNSSSKLLQIQEDEVILCEMLHLSSTDKGFPLSLQGEATAKDILIIET